MSKTAEKAALAQYLDNWRVILDSEECPDLPQFMAAFRVEGIDGQMVPFYINVIQERIWAVIKKALRENRPIRIIIVKARQMGCSTFIDAAWILEKVLRHAGQKCVIMADNEAHTEELYQSKVIVPWSQIPEQVRPEQTRSNRKELVLMHQGKSGGDLRKKGRSFVQVVTGGRRTGTRSGTIQHLHISEPAFMQHDEETVGGTLKSVHYVPGTSIILESTANGARGIFYRMCMAAQKGENDYTLLFFPWFDFPEYKRDFRDELEREKFAMTMTTEEVAIQRLYELSLEQMKWRRWCINDTCFGDPVLFQIDYPATVEESFVMSGMCRFDKSALLLLEKDAPEPISRGRLFFYENKWRFFEEPEGWLTLYAEPEEGRQYIMGFDTAEGIDPHAEYDARSDFSAACVYDRRSRKLMARIHARLDVFDFADQVWNLAMWFNEALVVGESNSIGLAVLKRLADREYPALYTQTVQDSVSGRKRDRLGFWMSGTSRHAAIAALAGDIFHGRMELSVEQVKECRAFVSEDGKRWKAQEGAHDDEVVAVAVVALVNQQEPYQERDASRPRPMEKSRVEKHDERIARQLSTPWCPE